MNPVINNVIVTICGILYVFSVVSIMDFAVKKGFPQDLSRKIVHVAAGSWLIFWPLYDQSDWTKYLNITPALIWTVLLLIKGFTAGPNDQAVKTMTRTGDPKELLKGPLYFTLVMNLMGTVFFYSPFALTSMGLLGWGDGLAPVFGKRFGKHKYNLYAEKSIEGSIAFFIFGFLAAIVFQFLFFNTVDIKLIFICAVLTTFIEAISPKNLDNVFIPVACFLVYTVWGMI
jgi:phytol kinase